MASRLSDEAIKSSYERGLRGLVVRRDRKLPDLIGSSAANIDELLSNENVQEAVQSVEPVALYRAILAKGPADCIDLLPYMSAEQVTRILDYEAWRENRLEPLRAIEWLMLFNENSPTDMFNRMKEQEEEFQLALLGPYIELLDEEEFERVPDHERDGFIALPCNTLYYRIKSEDPRIQKFIETLVGSGLEVDLQYTYSLLAHACHLPPTEQEEQLAQFRQARMEEDGFVSYDESLQLFARIDIEKLRKQWCTATESASGSELVIAETASANSPFLVQVLNRLSRDISPVAAADLTRSMIHTANMICTATGTEAGEEAQLRDLMYNMQALVSLGLEYLSDGSLDQGVHLLSRVHPQQLFRTGLTLVAKVADSVLASLRALPLIEGDVLGKMWQRDRRGALLHWLEVNHLEFLGYERLEFLKGLFNRFPMFVATTGSEGNLRLEFHPVLSMADLREITIQALAFAQEVRLFLSAFEVPSVGATLDRVLTTATARACLQGQFIADPLTGAEIRTLAGFSQEKLATAFGECSTAIAEKVRSALTSEGHDIVIARAAADRVVGGISDIYFDLVAGLSGIDDVARSSEDAATSSYSTLAPIVLLDNANAGLKETTHHA